MHPALRFLLCIALTPSLAQAQAPEADLLGRWDMTISRVYDYPLFVMVGLTDHATPLKTAVTKANAIEFVSPKGEEGFPSDMLFKGTLAGNTLNGTVTAADGTAWTWTGVRAPALQRSAPPVWDKPVSLFNGKDLTGWVPRTRSDQASWKVESGTLVKDGNGPDLLNTSKFGDFKLHIEFNCGAEANSGVYLRGRYEVQVETDSLAEPNSHHTGGLYGYLAPHPEQPRKPGVWQTYDITLIGRNVTVVQNGITVIDHKDIPGITGGALDSHEALPGPIYLQSSEKGRVAYRNIVITPAKP